LLGFEIVPHSLGVFYLLGPEIMTIFVRR
jgi:hypothetical protein